MSSNEAAKSRDQVLAAREAKKLAKQKGKNKDAVHVDSNEVAASKDKKEVVNPSNVNVKEKKVDRENKDVSKSQITPVKSKDEVDRAVIKETSVSIDKSKDEVKAERAAKKAAKLAKKKKEGDKEDSEMTLKDVVETLKDIVTVAKEVQDVTAKVQAINLGSKKPEESAQKKSQVEIKPKPEAEDGGKSKAELRAERRAKQEAQRAAKQTAMQQKESAPAKKSSPVESKQKAQVTVPAKEERPPKAASVEKTKSKTHLANQVGWFIDLEVHDEDVLKKVPINSNLHPAIVKLGVQLATRVVCGSNARCIALLDALKNMVKDYTLPAKTEFGRGLEAALAASLRYLWSMRTPSASQTNAVKFFRHNLTQLPNNVDEFDAKKTLQEEIDRYIREQIDMAGEAISLAVRNKICDGDSILTYGCSSLIERILTSAWECGVKYRCVVVGSRVGAAGEGARGLARRLARTGLPTCYADFTAITRLMPMVDKVVLGARCVLGAGSVCGAAGSRGVALAAAAANVPLLVACETHKFSDKVHTDTIVYDDIGDPDELIDTTDENSPLKDWRSNPNLMPLNLRYDVTPPSLVTAVVTELAVLPCTSAPVVLRFKLAEYGMQA